MIYNTKYDLYGFVVSYTRTFHNRETAKPCHVDCRRDPCSPQVLAHLWPRLACRPHRIKARQPEPFGLQKPNDTRPLIGTVHVIQQALKPAYVLQADPAFHLAAPIQVEWRRMNRC
jgi:hypothetical protein